MVDATPQTEHKMMQIKRTNLALSPIRMFNVAISSTMPFQLDNPVKIVSIYKNYFSCRNLKLSHGS